MVRRNLHWLNDEYKGKEFWLEYKGHQYLGFVEQVGWRRNRGYLAKVEYNDGYTEMVQLKKLNDYLEQGLKYEPEVVNYDVNVGDVHETNGKQSNQLEDSGVGCGSALDRLNLELKGAQVRKEFGYMGYFTGLSEMFGCIMNWGFWLIFVTKTRIVRT